MVPLEKVRNTLLERRELLVTSINLASSNTNLSELLEQVDAALSRVSAGTYGTCEICKQPIEDDRLHADPLVRSCASHLAPEELGRVVNDKRLASIYLGDTNYLGDTGVYTVLTPKDLRVDLRHREPVGAPSLPTVWGPRRLRSLRQRLVESLKAAWRVFRDRETEQENSTDVKKNLLQDSSRAHRLQSMLLPQRGFGVAAWETY